MNAGTMRAAVLHRPGDLRYEEVPVPALRPGDALVRIAAAGHCGSDLRRIMVAGGRITPLIPGHEFAGRVTAVAPDVETSWLGQRAAVIPLVPCGKCAYCRTSTAHLCLDAGFLGSRCHGGYAEYAAVPVQNLLPLPDTIDDEEGAAVEPIAVALHGIRRAGGVGNGETTVVLGAGAIGGFVIQWLKVLGTAAVIAVDVDGAKLEVARELGADRTVHSGREDVWAAVMDATRGMGAALVVEASGVPAVENQALGLLRRRGRVLFLGRSHTELRVPADFLFQYEAALYGSCNATFGTPDADWETARGYVARGRIRAKPLVSHRLPLSEAPAVYRAMHEGRFPHHLVLFIP